jgi:chloramphenicol 3-O-phosphotransferase
MEKGMVVATVDWAVALVVGASVEVVGVAAPFDEQPARRAMAMAKRTPSALRRRTGSVVAPVAGIG